VADLRERQAAGELPADLEPAQLLLALFAAACAPVMLPQIAHRLGLDPAADGFTESYPALVARIVELLGRPQRSV
jgi:TetR/AcrR family transcriptional regulator